MDQYEKMVCPKADQDKVFIDYNGKVIVRHVVDRSFDPVSYTHLTLPTILLV